MKKVRASEEGGGETIVVEAVGTVCSAVEGPCGFRVNSLAVAAFRSPCLLLLFLLVVSSFYSVFGWIVRAHNGMECVVRYVTFAEGVRLRLERSWS